MKVLTVVGARPQFIKAAVVSRELRKHNTEILVHTGQHYDYNMSDVFFEELEIPKPDYNLGISGGSHGEMTGKMLSAIEEVLQKESPELLLVYGDTNSTMAAALAAVKLHIPVCHVEAGNRFGTLDSPEEVNRIVTDHVSSVVMPCTQSAYDFLVKEGLKTKATVVGDPMYDAFEFYRKKVSDKQQEELISLNGETIKLPEKFYYLTCHRQENTGNDDTLKEILSAMNSLDAPCIYPVHPRNHERVLRLNKQFEFNNVLFCNPVGYLMSVFLTLNAEKIITDSGGLQREAFFAGKKCVTVLDFVVWPETMVEGRNTLAKPEKNDILTKLSEPQRINDSHTPFGDGHSAEIIVKTIESFKKRGIL